MARQMQVLINDCLLHAPETRSIHERVTAPDHVTSFGAGAAFLLVILRASRTGSFGE